MAFVNEILVGRFNELIRRKFNIRGGAPVPQVSPEIMTAIVLEDDRIEDSYLSREMRVGLRVIQAAVAAAVARFAVHNPAGSGKLVTVEGVGLSAAAAITAIFGSDVSVAFAGAETSSVNRDFRFSNAPVSTVQQDTNASAVVVNPNHELDTTSAGQQAVTPPNWGVVLPPNTHLVIVTQTVNLAVDFWWWGRERELQTSEQ